jgi:hypothetical protein
VSKAWTYYKRWAGKPLTVIQTFRLSEGWTAVEVLDDGKWTPVPAEYHTRAVAEGDAMIDKLTDEEVAGLEVERLREALRAANTFDELEAALSAAGAWVEAYPDSADLPGMLASIHVADMALVGLRRRPSDMPPLAVRPLPMGVGAIPRLGTGSQER